MIDTLSVKKKLITSALRGELTTEFDFKADANTLISSMQADLRKNGIKDDLSEAAISAVPFELPKRWAWIRHNSIIDLVGGSQPPKSMFESTPKDGYVRLYQIRDYGAHPVPVYVPKDKVSKFAEKGDILIARYGGSLGKVFWAKKGAYNVAMTKAELKIDSHLINSSYLFYYYNSDIFQNCLLGISRSAQVGFNKKELKELLLPLPCLDEQDEIVRLLENAFKQLVACN